MADLSGFDANTVEPSTDFEPLPADKYEAIITESEFKPTKAGTGRYLQLTFQVIEGQYKNRFLWARLNLQNPNDTAVKIAQSELSAICRAIGVTTPRDSVELHNLPLVIRVRCKTRTDTGEMTNEIKGYAKKEKVAVAVSAQTAAGAPPWSPS
ncbi:MAG: DUF669 domain-containing protein [Planctomycetaceae bacterium]|jgi:hypothetical protein|nr:DUF669 domain-containing protein [Planctomycetaceae bacterium]